MAVQKRCLGVWVTDPARGNEPLPNKKGRGGQHAHPDLLLGNGQRTEKVRIEATHPALSVKAHRY